MGGLIIPLDRGQIESAGRLHSELPFWRAADNALEALAQKFPGYLQDAALLKVVSINSLYFTNVYAVARMAQHVESVMVDFDPGKASPDIVARIAELPRT